MTAQTSVQQVPVGSYFGLPGVTQPLEQFDVLTGISTPLALGNQVPWNPSGPLQKTDIIKYWELSLATTFTTAVTGATLSPWAPYNQLQNLKLKMQGQYSPVELESGIDGAIFQSYRPMGGQGAGPNVPNNLGVNVAATFANAAMPQPNQITSGIVTNPALNATWKYTLEIPGGVWIDKYYDLAEDGTILAGPMGAFVSPQYMAGGERNVTPQFSFAPLNASNSDAGPLVASTAGAATVLSDVRRVGYYASSNPAALPPVFNWQYRRASQRVNQGARTKIDIPITEFGQVLSVFVRIFQPTGNIPLDVTTITKAQLIYGSNLYRFDDDLKSMQLRFMRQHGFLPPVGTVIWDLMANTSGGDLSNDARVLNTLTNANTHVHLEFSSALTADSYAVVGTELLVPVSTV
jgi:hypothetical protein